MDLGTHCKAKIAETNAPWPDCRILLNPALPHSSPVGSQLHLFTTEELPRMAGLALGDWVFFCGQVLINLQSRDTELEVGTPL